MRYLRTLLLVAPVLVALVATGGVAFHAPVHDLATDPADFTVVGSDDTQGLFGESLAAGDFNGDGIDDLLVGARRGNGGAAYVIFGSPDLSGTAELAFQQPDFAVFGADTFDDLGAAVTAGDFNGDGIDDLLLAASEADGGTIPCVFDEDTGDETGDRCVAGKAYVIFGSPQLGGTIDLALEEADVTVTGAYHSNFLGRALAAGDFNGDGVDDLVAAARGPEEGSPGVVYVIFGSPALGGTVDLAAEDPDVTVNGVDLLYYYGVGSLAAGDFNGDGIDDLLLGDAANDQSEGDQVYVIFGSQALGGTIDLAVESAGLTVIGAEHNDDLGSTMAAGDFNGDGIDDLLLGALGADGPGTYHCIGDGGTGDRERCQAGEAYVIFGSSTLGGMWDLAEDPPDLTILGPWKIAYMSSAVTAGDLDGDGIDELIVSSQGQALRVNGRIFRGAEESVYVIPGSSNLGGTVDLAGGLPIWVVQRTPANELDTIGFGYALAVGDFNGDEAADLLVGAPNADADGNNSNVYIGQAYVFFGPPEAEPAPLAVMTPTPTPAAEPYSGFGGGGDAEALPDTGGTPPDGGSSALTWLAAIAGASAVMSVSVFWIARQARRVR